MNRRKFIAKASALGAALSLTTSVSAFVGNKPSKTAGIRGVKIVPVEGFSYPSGFLEFISDKEFSTVHAAVMAVRNQNLPYVLEPLS